MVYFANKAPKGILLLVGSERLLLGNKSFRHVFSLKFFQGSCKYKNFSIKKKNFSINKTKHVNFS